MKLDLSKIQDRMQFVHNCEENLISELRRVMHVSPEAVVSIRNEIVEIGVNYEKREGYAFDFASEIKLYIHSDGRVTFASGSSGSFAPNETKSLFWRTLHGGEVMKNWDQVVKIVKKWHSEVMKLHDIPLKTSELSE